MQKTRPHTPIALVPLRPVISLLLALVVVLTGVAVRAEPPHDNLGKGVNYATGNGTDQLNCDSGNRQQISADMAALAPLHLQWVRLETYWVPVKNPSCIQVDDGFRGLGNLLEGVGSTGARPLLNILGYTYDDAVRQIYLPWLRELLLAAPDIQAFEIGDEENLSTSTESYPGADPLEHPYGWNFDASDFAADDSVGICPTDAAKNADLERAVTSYVAWLADTYDEIKRYRPDATVILGGISSWQASCWIEKLGAHRAYDYVDAIGFHPYGDTPKLAAATLRSFKAAVRKWPKELPIWITEFGFNTSGSSAGGALNEAVKAEELIATFDELSRQVRGPLVQYTARDVPLTTAQWQTQCTYVACQVDTTGTKAGLIPGTDYLVSGYGLFEWLDGTLIKEPSYEAFARARRCGP